MKYTNLTRGELTVLRKLEWLASCFGGRLIEYTDREDRPLFVSMNVRGRRIDFEFIFKINKGENTLTKWTLFSQNRQGRNLTNKHVRQKAWARDYLRSLDSRLVR